MSPLHFFENQKRCPDFGKKGSNCVHLWVNFSIENIVLRVSWSEIPKFCRYGVFSLSFLMKCFIEMP